MGLIINMWPSTGSAVGGGYAPEGYQAAFCVMLATQASGLAWFLLFRRAKV